MLKPPKPANETERLRNLAEYEILDTPPEQEIDDLTEIASFICGTPVAMVSLIDSDRQWWKSVRGVEGITETPRDIAVCAYAILTPNIFIVPDLTNDKRFSEMPYVVGEPKHRFYAGMPIVTPEGNALGTICVLDNRPKILTEQQSRCLEALGRQVGALFELRRANIKLERLGRQKDEFLAIASHDLKNPLSVVGMSAQLMYDDLAPGTTLTEVHHGMLGSISRQAGTMKRIILDYLDFQAMEDGQLKLTLALADFNALVREAVESNAAYASSKNSSITFEPADGLQPINLDAPRIQQVALNFIGNAVKFSPQGSEIIVRVLPTEDGVRFEVSDSGPGLTDEDFRNVFQKYAKLSSKPTGGEKSSGLGLAICKQLVELHGGTCGVFNNEDSGATFWFELPGNPPA
ncbi:MAG: GAF domain-containing sensor histidine kinase [Candidatus Sumerlaeaceae bacterium]|nr:GAF domain-containing sensor histidine kinase [Candidatus Sumerlaeaceae bacterium]